MNALRVTRAEGFFALSPPDLYFHPATKILLWLGFAVAVQEFDLPLLGASSALAVLALLITRAGASLNMLRRSRWLLLSLLLVYAFATPGDPVFPELGTFSPTIQGLLGGGTQAWRLALLLATLALLLHTCPRENLLSGIYILLKPYRFLGLDPERIAVRLWLTLRYAEQRRSSTGARNSFQAWWQELRLSGESTADAAAHVSIELAPFTWRDTAILAIAALLLGVALW